MAEIEVTDAMRQAVYTEDCARLGHLYSFDEVIGSVPTDEIARPVLRASDRDKFPHITCNRCDSVWLVFPDRGTNYDDAERLLYARLRTDTEFAKSIVRARGQREGRTPRTLRA